MTPDFLGNIGGLEFVTGEQAFGEAADAAREGRFGREQPCDEGSNRESAEHRDYTGTAGSDE